MRKKVAVIVSVCLAEAVSIRFASAACTTGTCASYNDTTSGATTITGESIAGIGVYGTDSSTGAGVKGASSTGNGVEGSSTLVGVAGNLSTTSCASVLGGCAGVLGTANNTYYPGVQGSNVSGPGVVGLSDNATEPGAGGSFGVYGASAAGNGVYGVCQETSGYANGVEGDTSNSGNGVYGTTSGSGNGVYGNTSSTGNGVYAVSSGGIGTNSTGATWGLYASSSYTGSSSVYSGVYGGTASASGFGVWGANSTASGVGVYGVDNATSGTGVLGKATSTSGGTGVSGQATGASGIGIYGQNTSSSGVAGYFDGNVNVVSGFSYYYNGTTCIGGSCTPSDRRLKKNIAPLSGALDRLLQIEGVTYEWKNPDARHPVGTQTGVVAQNVEKVFPEWVSETPDSVKVLNIDPRTLLGVSVEAIRTLKNDNDDLKKQLKAVKEDTADRLDRLENGTNPPRAGLTFGNGGWAVAGVMFGALAFGRRKQQTV